MSCSISVSCCNNNFLSSPHSAQLSPGTLVTTHWTRIKDHTIGHSTSNSASSSKFHHCVLLVAVVLHSSNLHCLPCLWHYCCHYSDLAAFQLLCPTKWSLTRIQQLINSEHSEHVWSWANQSSDIDLLLSCDDWTGIKHMKYPHFMTISFNELQFFMGNNILFCWGGPALVITYWRRICGDLTWEYVCG